MSCIDLGEMRQDMKELSLAIWSQGDAVRHLHGADGTLAEGLCHTIQRLGNELDTMLPANVDDHLCLSQKERDRLLNVSDMLLAAVADNELEPQTAHAAAQEIRLALGVMP